MPGTTTDAVATFVRSLVDNPSRAAATMSVATELASGLRCVVPVRQHATVVDEPTTIGGTDEGASPVELALAALASCQAITYRVWADQLGIQLERVRVEVDGDIDLRGFFGLSEGVRAGFTGSRLRVSLEGPESPERYAELAEVVDQHCPVLDILSNPVPVERTLVHLAE